MSTQATAVGRPQLDWTGLTGAEHKFASVAVGYQWTLLACTLVPVVIEVARGLHTKAVAQPLGHHAHCSFCFQCVAAAGFSGPFLPVRSVSAHVSGSSV
jgi:hypothetical protein